MYFYVFECFDSIHVCICTTCVFGTLEGQKRGVGIP